MPVVQRSAWTSIVWLLIASCDPSPFEIESPAPRRDAGIDSGTAQSEQPGERHDSGPPSDRDSGTRDASDAPQAGRAGQLGDDAGASAGGSGSAGRAGGGEQQGGAGSSGSAGAPAEVCQRPDPDAAVSVVEVREAGTVANPATIALRVPGPISWMGSKLTWLFPKSMRPMNAIGADAAPNQPNAAFVSRADPTKLEEDLDPDGVPRRFLTADDQQPMSELWPTALLRVPPPAGQDNATGLAFVRVSVDLRSHDVAIGRVSRNSTTAQEPLTPLFTGSDSKFSTGGFRGSENAYLFACTADTSIEDRSDPRHFPCKIARVKLTEIEQRESYRVYDPAQESWVADLSAGAPVLYGPPGMLSLSHNNYLGRYIAVHSRWFSNDVVVQSAKAPTGPWREELTFTLPSPSVGVVQAALEQPALLGPDECARVIWISYLAPTADSGGFPIAGEIKLVRVELK
jgi:hypothetical protein